MIRRHEMSVPQPLSPSFRTLHHPHLNTFVPGPVRSEQNVEVGVPLIGPREESNVSDLNAFSNNLY